MGYYSVIYFLNERASDTYNKTNKTQKHYAEWKKFYIKEYILYSSTHVKFYNRKSDQSLSLKGEEVGTSEEGHFPGWG